MKVRQANSLQMFFPLGSNQQQMVVRPKSLCMTRSIKGVISEVPLMVTVSGWHFDRQYRVHGSFLDLCGRSLRTSF